MMVETREINWISENICFWCRNSSIVWYAIILKEYIKIYKNHIPDQISDPEIRFPIHKIGKRWFFLEKSFQFDFPSLSAKFELHKPPSFEIEAKWLKTCQNLGSTRRRGFNSTNLSYLFKGIVLCLTVKQTWFLENFLQSCFMRLV